MNPNRMPLAEAAPSVTLSLLLSLAMAPPLHAAEVAVPPAAVAAAPPAPEPTPEQAAAVAAAAAAAGAPTAPAEPVPGSQSAEAMAAANASITRWDGFTPVYGDLAVPAPAATPLAAASAGSGAWRGRLQAIAADGRSALLVDGAVRARLDLGGITLHATLEGKPAVVHGTLAAGADGPTVAVRAVVPARD